MFFCCSSPETTFDFQPFIRSQSHMNAMNVLLLRQHGYQIEVVISAIITQLLLYNAFLSDSAQSTRITARLNASNVIHYLNLHVTLKLIKE